MVTVTAMNPAVPLCVSRDVALTEYAAIAFRISVTSSITVVGIAIVVVMRVGEIAPPPCILLTVLDAGPIPVVVRLPLDFAVSSGPISVRL